MNVDNWCQPQKITLVIKPNLKSFYVLHHHDQPNVATGGIFKAKTRVAVSVLLDWICSPVCKQKRPEYPKIWISYLVGAASTQRLVIVSFSKK